MITPLVITERDISVAWAKTFLELMRPGKTQRHPATIVISGLRDGAPVETLDIRRRLDRELAQGQHSLCTTVASTIFPRSLWNPVAANDAELLYSRYERAWEGIKKCPANRNGVYFRRLTSYHPVGNTAHPVNQLRFITDTFRGGNHRKSALQASILDPTRDHTHNRQKGFPCMQQVSFTPLGNGALSITGFYATQYQFEKAYGNYLGLYWLGRFMAKQLGLTLTQVVCVASVLRLGDGAKEKLEKLAADVRRILSAEDAAVLSSTPEHELAS